ncbi:MAG: adenylosuccinate synthetase, partial [Candidatus Thermoplasmatota archaeon]
MVVRVVVGAQWGDEGKGKIADYYAGEADYIVRYNGGTNAGHTVSFCDKEFKLHLLPCGILREGKIAVIGNGVVIDPSALFDEIAYIKEKGIKIGELRISERAHIVFPYH